MRARACVSTCVLACVWISNESSENTGNQHASLRKFVSHDFDEFPCGGGEGRGGGERGSMQIQSHSYLKWFTPTRSARHYDSHFIKMKPSQYGQNRVIPSFSEKGVLWTCVGHRKPVRQRSLSSLSPNTWDDTETAVNQLVSLFLPPSRVLTQ